jgi:hypothetical protein
MMLLRGSAYGLKMSPGPPVAGICLCCQMCMAKGLLAVDSSMGWPFDCPMVYPSAGMGNLSDIAHQLWKGKSCIWHILCCKERNY